MKKLTSILIVVLTTTFILSSCQGSKNKEAEKVKNEGKVIVLNGQGKNDTIDYKGVGCVENIKDTALLNTIIREMSERTKKLLNFPLTFNPQKIELTVIKQDSLYYFDSNKKIENTILVIAKSFYIAKNAYGTEIEGDNMTSFYVKDDKITDLEDQIRLDSLKFEGENINRKLSLYSKYDDSAIDILPTKGKDYIVFSSLNCVDEGTWLLIGLENGEEIKLVSWNDFNCDGKSYFNSLSNKQVQKLKEVKIKSISIVDKKSVTCMVPKNESDYFIQLMKLLYKN
jgi:hypothetical protein